VLRSQLLTSRCTTVTLHPMTAHRSASHRIVSTRIDSYQLALHRIDSHCIASTRVDSHRLASTRIDSSRVESNCRQHRTCTRSHRTTSTKVRLPPASQAVQDRVPHLDALLFVLTLVLPDLERDFPSEQAPPHPQPQVLLLAPVPQVMLVQVQVSYE
jgi:hypothetical protein